MSEMQEMSIDLVDSGDFDKGILVLRQEIDLLDKIIDIQCEIRATVIIREWEDFDGLMETLNVYNSEFETLETERPRVFSNILDNRETPEDSFYASAARMPDEPRHVLTDLYRELKIRVLRVRYENDALLKHLNEARAFTENFLDDVFPGRRGKLYTSKGTIVASDMRSMILNQSL